MVKHLGDGDERGRERGRKQGLAEKREDEFISSWNNNDNWRMRLHEDLSSWDIMQQWHANILILCSDFVTSYVQNKNI